MVCPELQLNSLRSRLSGRDHGGSIVDENVQSVRQRGNVRGGLADGLLRSKIQNERCYLGVGILLGNLS